MRASEAGVLARRLLSKHGLLAQGWRVEWRREMVRTGGTCNSRARVIKLSRKVVRANEAAGVRELVLHEIAHALTPGHGHGKVWQLVARSIGCSGERMPSKIVWPKGEHGQWCGRCGRVRWLHRRPRVQLVSACKGCEKESEGKSA